MLLRIKYLTIINITTPEFNKLEVENVTARLNQANLASKGDIAVSVKKTDFDDKLKNLNKKATSDKKLKTYDLSLFIGQSNLFNNGAQLCFILLLND